VKLINSKDGLFFQWMMCLGIFGASLVGAVFEGMASFSMHWPSAIGGAIWATGVVLVVPTLELIGIGLGTLVWASSEMVVGWATGHYGLFGTTMEKYSSRFLNTLGVLLVGLSLVLYVSIKPSPAKNDNYSRALSSRISSKETFPEEFLEQPLLNGGATLIREERDPISKASDSETKHRTLGVFQALLIGLFSGFHLVPTERTIDHGGDSHPLHYMFSNSIGIITVSTLFMSMYLCSCKIFEKKCWMEPGLIFPGLASGCLWALGEMGRLLANQSLGLSVNFPIITTGKSLFASLLGVFVFKEIAGTQNYVLLFFALIATSAAVTCIVLSK